MSKDSFYAWGIGVIKMKANATRNGPGFTGKTLELLECMTQAGALTKSAAAMALRCSRQAISNSGKALWYSGMIDIYKVYSRDTSGNNAQFHLWLAKTVSPLPMLRRSAAWPYWAFSLAMLKSRCRIQLAAAAPARPTGDGGSKFRWRGRQSDQMGN